MDKKKIAKVVVGVIIVVGVLFLAKEVGFQIGMRL